MAVYNRARDNIPAGGNHKARIAVGVVLLTVVGVGVWIYLAHFGPIGGAVTAADDFFTALQSKDWKRMYRLLPTEPQTSIVGGHSVTSGTSMTESSFVQNMEKKGLGFIGADFNVKYKILGALLTAPDSAKVRVIYAVGSADQVGASNMDSAKPAGFDYRGKESAHFITNTEDFVFKRIGGQWKYDMWQANGLGFSPF